MKKRIFLACSAGLSTSMMVQRMKAAAEKMGVDVEIEAHPTMRIRDILDTLDALLLGPQVRYELKWFQDKVGGRIPVEVINQMDYGMMNGEKVFKEIWEKVKK